MKREDLLRVAGVPGGKARTCLALARGAKGLVTAGSRASPQVNIVAQIARSLGLPCRFHTPEGEETPELAAAQAAGGERIAHKAGRNTVIIARARADASTRGWREIPFGMECEEAVEQTRRQVANLPAEIERLVVPVGSGMSLAGILWGLRDQGRADLPVVGICVGANPRKRLARFAPPGWEEQVELLEAAQEYEEEAEQTTLEGLALDPIYEAKAIPYLCAGDCLWIVGIRASALPPEIRRPRWLVGDAREVEALCAGEEPFDFLFSCPPYFDLEVYSEDPADLSRSSSWEKFREAHGAIIRKAAGLLREDRFAFWVVSEIRDSKTGLYRGLVPHTIEAFRAAGLELYNEAALVAPLGSLPVRVSYFFGKGRKLGRNHQNVLVFVKGDPAAACRDLGPVEIAREGLEAALDSEIGPPEGDPEDSEAM
jgi:hypothetical protein